jgi:anti-anti-sigma factor
MVEETFWRLDVGRADGVATLSPQGDLDMETSPDLIETANREVTGGAHRVVINLSAVTFVDSSGIGALVMLWRTIGDQPGGFAITAPSRAVQSVLETTGIDRLLERV